MALVAGLSRLRFGALLRALGGGIAHDSTAAVPVTKVLNRLPIEELLEMQHALAQHFHALYMQVRDTVDAQRPGPSIGEQGRRLSSMRIIDVVPLHRALPGKVEDK
jgi:hypothetical protein